MDFTVIRDKSVVYSVEAPTTAVGVFKIALHRLRVLEEQPKLLASLNRLPNATGSSDAQIQSLWPQISSIRAV